ncbi:hypothetical protein A6A08_19440 [Nocardiopsis sp. TSRI0078]|uniref:hypothetical protein n=1 Tax=unclassified Nocardiopsis TaxID=2649073 RepID=UPI00093DDF4A|nr:hypothetical protein [Nocardiopsis sp. TSRI0078]OKI22439.1 hypothetical protein A6A08_19440 [Nocardiopsis sp. TSRI0078]
MRTIADQPQAQVRWQTLIGATFLMVGMLLTGTAAYMGENHGLLAAAAVLFLVAVGLQAAWAVMRYRQRRHGRARPPEEP